MFDALVIGAGPAGTMIAGALTAQGLRVQGLTATPLRAPWPNTYGIWRDELEAFGLEDLLGHCWENCVSYFGKGEVEHHRAYGLIDKAKMQAYLLERCEGVDWQQGKARSIAHHPDHSCVTTEDGAELRARVVVDASGHQPAFVARDMAKPVAYQAAYGIVGKFSKPPVEPEQFVLMDFRRDHLSAADKEHNPPTFVYAMDFGNDIYFVEETSLAAAPAVGFDLLERRLIERLRWSQIEILETHEVERCLFPMNLPMPKFDQPVVGFGGAASMVHPASGYSIGAQLRRAPDLARGIAIALKDQNAPPQVVATSGWQALWSADRLRKYYLYRLGLEKLMRFDAAQIDNHFDTFFSLPKAQWSGFLADGLTTPELVLAMMKMFAIAPNNVRLGLMQMQKQEAPMLWEFLRV